MDLLPIAEEGVRRALARGADHAEAYVMRARTTRVAAAGEYAQPTLRADDGVAIRVMRAGRLGTGGVTRLAGLDAAIEDALDAAARPSAPAAWDLPPPMKPHHEEGARPAFDAAADERALDLVEGIVHDALARPAITYVQADLRRTHRELAIVNSAGVAVTDRAASESLEVELRVSRGTTNLTTRDGHYEDVTRLAAHDVVGPLATRATDALERAPLPSTLDTVILNPAPAAQLIGLISSAFTGGALAGGKSPLTDKHGEAAYAERFTLHDDPRGHRIFDDEGTPTRRQTLVDQGVFKAALHDSRSASDMGVESTGNAHRNGLLGGVVPRPRRLLVGTGDASFDELVEMAERALIVPDAMVGSFASDKVTADFSVVAPFAFYVEGGRIKHATPPVTVGGNAHEVFRTLKAAGRDARAYSTTTVPALLSGGVTCAT